MWDSLTPTGGKLFDFEVASYKGPAYDFPRHNEGGIIEETYTMSVVIGFLFFFHSK